MFSLLIFFEKNFKWTIYNFRFNFPDLTPGASIGYKCKSKIFEQCWSFNCIWNSSPNYQCLTWHVLFSYKIYTIDAHLSRQHYKACVRKAAGKAYICYIGCSTLAGTTTINQADNTVTTQVGIRIRDRFINDVTNNLWKIIWYSHLVKSWILLFFSRRLDWGKFILKDMRNMM